MDDDYWRLGHQAGDGSAWKQGLTVRCHRSSGPEAAMSVAHQRVHVHVVFVVVFQELAAILLAVVCRQPHPTICVSMVRESVRQGDSRQKETKGYEFGRWTEKPHGDSNNESVGAHNNCPATCGTFRRTGTQTALPKKRPRQANPTVSDRKPPAR